MKRIILSIISILLTLACFTLLPACDNQCKQPEPKRIVGIDSEKTYIRTEFWARAEVYDYKELDLPIISRDEIKPDEIDGVTLDYRATSKLDVSEYRLVDNGKKEEYYYYTLYIFLSGSYIYNCQIDSITVDINGEDYVFSADMTFGCANGYPDYFIHPANALQMLTYRRNGNAAEIDFIVSINSMIEITDISFMTDGIEVTSLKISGENINLPYSLNGKDMRVCVTYTEPDDCLYYGNYVKLTFNAKGQSMTYTSAQGFNRISCAGSALRG